MEIYLKPYIPHIKSLDKANQKFYPILNGILRISESFNPNLALKFSFKLL